MTDYFATLARYHVPATGLLLKKVALMDEQDYRSDAGLFFKPVHGTLNHMLVGVLLLPLYGYTHHFKACRLQHKPQGSRIALQ